MTTRERQVFPLTPGGPEYSAGATRYVMGRDLQVNDVLYFLSTPHRVTHFADYDGPLSVRHGGPMPEGTRIAYAGNPDDPKCWGITIDPMTICRLA